MMLERITVLVSTVKELLDLLFKLDRLVVERHEIDFLREGVVALSHLLGWLSCGFVSAAAFGQDGLCGLYFLDRDALSGVEDADKGELRVCFFEKDGVLEE